MKFALIVSSALVIASCNHLIYEDFGTTDSLSHMKTLRGGKKHHQHVSHMKFY
jgi:hypothetical protein